MKRLQTNHQREKQLYQDKIEKHEEKVINIEKNLKELSGNKDEIYLINADLQRQNSLLKIRNDHLEQQIKDHTQKLIKMPKEKQEVIEEWKLKYQILEKKNIAAVEALREIFNNSIKKEIELKEKEFTLKIQREQQINQKIIEELKDIIKNNKERIEFFSREKEEYQNVLDDLTKNRDVWKSKYENLEKISNKRIMDYKGKLDEKTSKVNYIIQYIIRFSIKLG